MAAGHWAKYQSRYEDGTCSLVIGLEHDLESANLPGFDNGEGTDSPGLLMTWMSRLFRSVADRANVSLEESHDGRVYWGRVGALVHRPHRCRERWQSGARGRTHTCRCPVPAVWWAELAPAQSLRT